MRKMMGAAIATSFGRPLILSDVAIPSPGPGELLVKVAACGVCHTDLHAVDGDWPVKPKLPFIPGHEVVGDVAAVVLTHAHSDHTGIAGKLHERGVPVLLHSEDHQLLATGNASSFYQVPSNKGVNEPPNLNYVRGRVITVSFEKQEVQTVVVQEQAAGIFLEPGNDSTAAKPKPKTGTPRGLTRPGSSSPIRRPDNDD